MRFRPVRSRFEDTLSKTWRPQRQGATPGLPQCCRCCRIITPQLLNQAVPQVLLWTIPGDRNRTTSARTLSVVPWAKPDNILTWALSLPQDVVSLVPRQRLGSTLCTAPDTSPMFERTGVATRWPAEPFVGGCWVGRALLAALPGRAHADPRLLRPQVVPVVHRPVWH